MEEQERDPSSLRYAFFVPESPEQSFFDAWKLVSATVWVAGLPELLAATRVIRKPQASGGALRGTAGNGVRAPI